MSRENALRLSDLRLLRVSLQASRSKCGSSCRPWNLWYEAESHRCRR